MTAPGQCRPGEPPLVRLPLIDRFQQRFGKPSFRDQIKMPGVVPSHQYHGYYPKLLWYLDLFLRVGF